MIGDLASPTVGAADTLSGDAGDDLMIGGIGDEWYFVAEAGDKIVELAGQGTDLVFSKVDHVLAANVEQLFLTDAAVKGTGNASDNKIEGNTKDNILIGFGGNDTLDGGFGTDTMAGGAGNDIYNVDNAGDQYRRDARVRGRTSSLPRSTMRWARTSRRWR